MEDLATLVLRITVGSVFIAHGVPKVFGPVTGPHGRGRTVGLLTSRRLPMPELLVWGLALTELVGGAFVLVGLLTRVAAVPLAVVVALAIPLAKWKHGFIDGWDWPYSLVGACTTIALLGGGEYSLDASLGLPF